MTSKQGILKLYKNRGETPLECILRFKKDNPRYRDIKMTYAGRLDPLAEGLLLVLYGDECKNKDKYLNLDKVYELDVLFGFSTDTYDLLGLVNKELSYKSIKDEEIIKIIKSFLGKFSQKYPLYSSKTINGESLFSLARKKQIDNKEIPEKEVSIKKIQIIESSYISKEKLDKKIKKSVSLVTGDFRQKDILLCWKENIKVNQNKKYKIISMKISCTSGTYMRSLANSIGVLINIPSLAFGIKRLRVGKYSINK